MEKEGKEKEKEGSEKIEDNKKARRREMRFEEIRSFRIGALAVGLNQVAEGGGGRGECGANRRCRG